MQKVQAYLKMIICT